MVRKCVQLGNVDTYGGSIVMTLTISLKYRTNFSQEAPQNQNNLSSK